MKAALLEARKFTANFLRERPAESLRRHVMGELAQRRGYERSAAGFVSLFMAPAVIGVLGAFSEKIGNALGGYALLTAWIIVILLFGLSAIQLHLPDRCINALLDENESLTDEAALLNIDIEQLKRAIQLLTLQVNFCESVRGVTLTHIGNPKPSLSNLRDSIDDLINPICLQVENLFDCGGSERWCLTVYLYSKAHSTERLLPVWRRASATFPASGTPRVWAMGQGHVGKAFVDHHMIITGDVTAAEIADFAVLPQAMSRQYDDTLYLSFASIPIGPILDVDGRPYGVLVATSDKAGRFNRANSSILVQGASSIASLLIAGDFDIDNIADVTSSGKLEDLNDANSEGAGQPTGLG